MAVEAKRSKMTPRMRRKYRLRRQLLGSDAKPRICIFKSGRHIYAQLISDESHKTLVSASTLDKEVLGRIGALKEEELKGQSRSSKSVAAEMQVGTVLAERAKGKGFAAAVFDRNGFRYHGRVKSVADGARKAGLHF